MIRRPIPLLPLSLLLRNLVWFLTGSLLAASVYGDSEKAPSPSDPSEPWELVSRYQFREASRQFEQLLSPYSQPNARALQFGAALSTLNHPALKASESRHQLDQLTQLWETRGEPADDISLWAAYTLGRWYQNQPNPGDYDNALLWYQQTARHGESHYVAQLAQLKATGLLLYAPLESSPSLETRLQGARLGEKTIHDPGIRISYLLLLSDGMLLHRQSKEEVIGYLEEALALGLNEPRYRAKTLAQLGSLFQSLNQIPQARRYYEQFLQEFPVNIRTTLIRDRLAEFTHPASEETSQP